MKARKRGGYSTVTEARREVNREIDDAMPQLFQKHAEMLLPQVTATFLWTMATRYGWGEKRLRQLAEAIHDTEYLMENPSKLHHRFDPIDLIRVIKEKYGIDLEKEFPVRTEVQK